MSQLAVIIYHTMMNEFNEMNEFNIFQSLRADRISVFTKCCERWNLSTAQWLLAITPDINVHQNDEYVFRISCKYACLPIAQWLLAVRSSIDIHADYECAFRWTFLLRSCSNLSTCFDKCLHIARWLVHINTDLSNQYYLVNDIGYIYNHRPDIVWKYVHDLGYGYLHYDDVDHLDTIITHHHMIVYQSTQKSARFN